MAISGGDPASAYYAYYCPGYTHDNEPNDCHANPYTSPGMYTWMPERAVTILRNDGHGKAADLLSSPLGGRTYLRWIEVGATTADVGQDGNPDGGLSGCTSYGRSIGWPLGDHMLNPYRGFGVLSYTNSPTLGWQGFQYASTNGRTTGSCASAPRVRSNGAAMTDEFFNRARKAWSSGDRVSAMFNLGIALHPILDETVPSHAHPEVALGRLTIRTPSGATITGRDAFPAWANEKRDAFRVKSGGLYTPPASANGVSISRTAGGWNYWMAALSYPYFPWSARWSAIPRSQVRCDVSDFPEECPHASVNILHRSQRVTAGFIEYYLNSVGAG